MIRRRRGDLGDCTLLIKMSGLAPACNLRELRDRLAQCSTENIHQCFALLSGGSEHSIRL